MNFLNYNPYGFMTLPQSNPIPMRQPQPVPQIQPPQMMQINQMQNMNDFATAFNQRNQQSNIEDQLRDKFRDSANTFLKDTLGLSDQNSAMLSNGLFSGEKRQNPGLLQVQAPQLSIPMSFSFDPVPQVADGSAQYVQMLRGLLA